MTLFRQLISLIVVTFLLIFAGTFWISLENTRSYLMLQLATQTQNATDALGLSLVPFMQAKDIAAIDTMVNAVFDSGYYQSLSLQTMAGDRLIERANTSHIEGVPAWFIAYLALETPQAESIITTGWRQAGRLQLVAHAGFAHQKLWQTSIDILYWSMITFMVALVAVLLILRVILKPLAAVEQQALAISQHEFVRLENIPRTRELRRVVMAMNQMSAKIAAFIAQLSERAEQMQQDAHYDALTGLVNRRGFEARLDNVLRDKEQGGHGCLVLIRMHDFAAYNKSFGHVAGDTLLCELGKLLRRLSEPYVAATAARITGTDFAVILPLSDANMADQFGALLSRDLDELSSTLMVADIAQTGIACFDSDSEIGAIMADADVGLSLAQHQGGNAYALQSSKSEALGNMAWQDLICQAMQHDHIHLLAQRVVSAQGQHVYSEVLMRIQDKADKAVSPGSFAAMAERLGLAGKLDRYVLERVAQILESESSAQSGVQKLGVNISARSIRDESFLTWLNSFFNQHKGIVRQMYFEISEHGLLQDISAMQLFVERVHAFGGVVVMEHFGTRMSSFQNLRQLKLDYIKLDGSYVRNIAAHSDHRFFLQTVADIAQGLGIKVIAEHVETADEFDHLKTLGIHAMQGYYFGEPHLLPKNRY
ncbi:MAG: EAL domain-containing protein [Mariprofundus sp.]|nr:EAL domain-containing protein [Mariprofundus sp.]